jgi:NADPH:quinone reductase-like Zn-dependent oxidoreductase
MRAWQVWRQGEPSEAIRLTTVPLPEPNPGEVRIRVAAAALGLPDGWYNAPLAEIRSPSEESPR